MLYDENRITLLARDAHWLFAYWEVSSDTKECFCNNFGKEIWEKSVPALKILNISKNESFYIRTNDFCNSWYINVPDSSSLYSAEIGRKVSDSFFVNIASSNMVSTSCDNVSSNTNTYFVDYRILKNRAFNLQNNQLYKQADFEFNSDFVLGPSSPELFSMNLLESISGISSAEILGINVSKQIGISSETIVK